MNEIEQIMKAYANDAVSLAKESGLSLDYSEKSLEDIDAVLNSFVGGAEKIVEQYDKDLEERLWLISKIFGAYVGEVVIKSIGGEWNSEKNENGSVRIILECLQIKCFPLEKIYKRLTEDPFSNVSGYCRAIRAIHEQGEQ